MERKRQKPYFCPYILKIPNDMEQEIIQNKIYEVRGVRVMSIRIWQNSTKSLPEI